MSDDRRAEEGFFEGTPREGGAGGAGGAATARRRDSRLLARSPGFAFVMIALCAWLLTSLWADVAYFFASRAPIDLGGPGAYRLEPAKENRLVQLRGPLERSAFFRKDLRGNVRAIGRLAGTSILVDHPGRTVPPVYEGRLLPASKREDYRIEADALHLGSDFAVVRDGERPGSDLPQAVGAALLLVVLLVNVRALVRPLIVSSRERR